MDSNKKAGTITVTENVVLETVDRATGKILTHQEVSNIIVDTGLERLARLSKGEAVDPFTSIAIGTGVVGVENDDVALGVEVARADATVTYEGAGVVKYVHLFTFGSGVAHDINEAGIFDTDVSETGTMLNRVLAVSPVAVDSETDLTVTITITYGR
jgi:hypothetical protein